MFTRFPGLTQPISKLSDRPNAQDGITANDLKARFDQTALDVASALDNLMTELEATTAAQNIGVEAIATSPQYLQGILQWLYDQIVNATVGEIPDGSITISKLAFDVGTQEELDSLNSSLVGAIKQARIRSYMEV